MSQRLPKGVATVAQVVGGETAFDAVIDVRSPGEYAEDHLPGAISCPVLADDERARVGTLYKQVSPFEAKKVGAVLVAKNIARAIEENFLDRPKTWRPLIYCWRGGKRSGAFTHILREIGWDAQRLDGGYKAWRQHVVAELATLPARYDYRIVSGATGSAKSRVLEALAREGAQVLHLEELAAHKGSVLGGLPRKLAGPPQEFPAPPGERTERSELMGGGDTLPQPSQRAFETRLWQALAGFDPARPIYAEAESRRIGTLHLPDAMIAAIRAAPCLRIDATVAARVDFLLRDYDYFLTDPERLAEKLGHLRTMQGHATVERWLALIGAGDYRTLVAELLEKHYDPLYQRSQAKNYADYRTAPAYATDDLTPDGIRRLAREILAG